MRSRFSRFETVLLTVTVVVGRTRLTFKRLSELKPGVVLPLDRAVGTPFELTAAGRRLGEVEPVASDTGIALKLVARPEKEKANDEPTR